MFMLTQHKETSLHASSIDTQQPTEPDSHNRVGSFVNKPLLLVQLLDCEVKMVYLSVTKT
jgi:hypothetical protein